MIGNKFMTRDFKEIRVCGSERIEEIYREEDKINRIRYRDHQEHISTIAMLERLLDLRVRPGVFVSDYQI